MFVKARTVNRVDMVRTKNGSNTDPDDIARSVGRRVAEIRAQHGFTQEQFAEILGYSVDRVQRIERGTNLTIASLCHLADALSCKVMELFEQPQSLASPPGRPPKRKLPKVPFA